MPEFASTPAADTPAPSRRAFNPLTLAALAALWIAVLGNWPLWRALLALPQGSSVRGLVFVAGFAVAVAALTFSVLALFAWRWTIRPVIAAVLLSAAVIAHFIGAYGVVMDPTMMVNFLQTDARETRDLLSWRFAFSVLFLAVLPAAWLWRLPLQRKALGRQALFNVGGVVCGIVLLVAMVVALFADLSATMRNHKSLRYMITPLNAYYSLGVVAAHAGARPAGPPAVVGADARLVARAEGAPPPLVLLVIGETARADHFALNGYARPTNPELSKRPVVSFRDVTSCGTSTAASLPCMFSAQPRESFDGNGPAQENLLDILQRAGLAVLWLDNQSGCKGLCDRVPHASAGTPAEGDPAPLAGLCEGGECLDEALLVGLDARLAALPADRRARGAVLVLHQMGSHGPAYFRRSPADMKPFRPECTTNQLQQCPLPALVNAYDNSIVYTDHVLGRLIDWAEKRTPDWAPALLYVSDHGESLGENNLFLHGLPFAIAPQTQKHVPMVLWLSATAQSAQRVPLDCMKGRADTPLTHDHLFHTVLGMAGVATSLYDPALDTLAPCRAH